MKTASVICIVLFCFWVILAIVDIWFDIVSWPLFIKLSLTCVLLCMLMLVLALIKKEK